jgi:hypothetical protein
LCRACGRARPGIVRRFSCFASRQLPNPNREYYVQVAEFVPLVALMLYLLRFRIVNR